MNTQTTFPKNYSRCDLKDNLFEHLDLIIDIPDYPVEGVTFKDVTPLSLMPKLFKLLLTPSQGNFSTKALRKYLALKHAGLLLVRLSPMSLVLGLYRHESQENSLEQPTTKATTLNTDRRPSKFTKMPFALTIAFLLLMIFSPLVEPPLHKLNSLLAAAQR